MSVVLLRAADLATPNNVMDMLASGRAVVATASAGPQLSYLLEDFGLVLPSAAREMMASSVYSR